VPPTVTVNGVFEPGVKLKGEGEQVLGGEVVPATQLRVTEFVYPFCAATVPLKAADCPAKTVSGVLLTTN
jgi:hypothetical protein